MSPRLTNLGQVGALEAHQADKTTGGRAANCTLLTDHQIANVKTSKTFQGHAGHVG